MIITIEEPAYVESDDSHQLINLLVLFALKTQLFSESFTESLVSNGDSLLNFLFQYVFAEEFGKGFGNFSFHEFGDALEGISCAFELVEIFEGNSEIRQVLTIFAIRQHR